MKTVRQADQLLRQLVSLLAVLAAIMLAWAVWQATADPAGPAVWMLGATTALVVVTHRMALQLRTRSATHAQSWTEASILLGIAFLPAHWVIICVAVGVALSRALDRPAPIKFAFNTAKAILATGVVLAAVTATTGQIYGTDPSILRQVSAMLIAGITHLVIDEILALPVLSLASGQPMRQMFISSWTVHLAAMSAKIAVAVGALLIWQYDPLLLVVVPPLVWVVQLVYSNRVRTQTEREVWQRLAVSTEALNDVDLTHVLHTAVTRTDPIFSADEVEVEIGTEPDRRLVRGSGESLVFDGRPGDAPDGQQQVYSVSLKGSDAGSEVGILRLRFHREVELSEREQYTLRTFASALSTAIRNASAYAALQRAAAEHARDATHDQLTSLVNRRALLDRGADVLGAPHHDGLTALLLVDLNHFKEVNDTLGHMAGDQVLREVARRLSAAARPGDLVARLGGDEFAVLLRDLSAPAVATHRAGLLLDTLHQPFEAEGMRLRVEASGGIAVATGQGGMTELLRRADVAMYQAKRSGERTAVYSRTTDTADITRLSLGGDLPRAVAEHEFVVDFQPILDLGTGEVLAAEALSRWHHPVRGHLDPMRFLETVERSGLLPAFTDAVLDKSLIAVKSWREAGFDLPVAVNVSPRSLLDPDFPDVVLARLAANDVPADRLVLELTETLALSQLTVVDRVLRQLREAGVGLALDDFGTGYSSLSAVPRIPVHEIKIDRTFVAQMESSPEAAAVVRATVELGRSLSLMVVAEGVESEPQRQALWELGCGAGQGHLFARAMPNEAFLAALQRGSGGHPGRLAPSLHGIGSVIRLSGQRRAAGARGRDDRLPHLPA